MQLKNLKSLAIAWLLPAAIVVFVIGLISDIMHWPMVYAGILEIFIIYAFFTLRIEQRITAWLVPVTVVVLIVGSISLLANWYIVYTGLLEIGIIFFFFAFRLEEVFIPNVERPTWFNWILTGITAVAVIVFFLPIGVLGMIIVKLRPSSAHWVAFKLGEVATAFLGTPIRYDGRKKLPVKGQCVVLANHTSLLDVVLVNIMMGADNPWTVIYAKKLEKSIPILGWLLKKFGVGVVHDPVENKYHFTEESKEKMEEKLDAGHSLFAYPEGKRRLLSDPPDVKILPFEPGAIANAWKRKLPIVPCVIYGAMKYKPRYGQRHLNPCPITICIGDPIPTSGRKLRELGPEVWNWMDATYRRLEQEAQQPKKLKRLALRTRLKWGMRSVFA